MTIGLLPWTSPLLAHLTSLTLNNCGRITGLSEAAEMFAALSAMRALERLELDLELVQRARSVSWRALPFPCGCRVDACVRSELRGCGEASTDFSPLFNAAAACVDITSAPIAQIHILPWVREETTIVDVVAWRRTDARTLALSFMDGAPLEHGLVASALEALRCADGLRSIAVAGSAGQKFRAVLAAAPLGFLPALTALELHDVHFSGDADWDELVLGLAPRRRGAGAGCPLKRLNMIGVQVPDAQVSRLREAVWGMENTVAPPV
ncbi:hypothetical protein FA95DRAFT_1613538 [Auriscalpium vulgare]|uniref:Uncharacterized protein n=1 Tax=Auriscalpium vulgare TaxID=40419 RepID=A0ACB8R2V1_9AGAM|nr:hypothetical protein FA95DRAFT_1613538 [Auriscalpium vulgare]